ncbi:MAG: YdeI/OmpD-associated family protein [Halobacteriales archaeon]|nr:YdeI/OmpD-associated family protein [Halobacteriales archaeon]
MLRFTAKLEREPGGGHHVALSTAQDAALRGRPHARVKGTLGGAPLRTTMFPYGGTYYLLVHKATVEAAGAKPGERVVIALEPDAAPRRLTMPKELRAALREAGLTKHFAALSFTRRKELALAVRAAKKPETRAKRIAAALDAARKD